MNPNKQHLHQRPASRKNSIRPTGKGYVPTVGASFVPVQVDKVTPAQWRHSRVLLKLHAETTRQGRKLGRKLALQGKKVKLPKGVRRPH